MKSRQLIILCVLLTGALAATAQLSKKEIPSIKIGIGVLALAVFLLTMADAGAAKFAEMFAVLVLISATLAVGPEAFNAITVAGGHKPSAASVQAAADAAKKG